MRPVGRIEGAAKKPDPHAAAMRGDAQAAGRWTALIHQRRGPMLCKFSEGSVTA